MFCHDLKETEVIISFQFLLILEGIFNSDILNTISFPDQLFSISHLINDIGGL